MAKPEDKHCNFCEQIKSSMHMQRKEVALGDIHKHCAIKASICARADNEALLNIGLSH